MTEITLIAEVMVTLGLGGLLGWWARAEDRSSPSLRAASVVKPNPPKRRCVGYEHRPYPESTIVSQRQDCMAFASTSCRDGRCRHHCAAMCRCEPKVDPLPDLPEHTGGYRDNVRSIR